MTGVQTCALPIFLMPSLVGTAFLPRRWTMQKYFTWHAELLPHTEQVVFHKTLPFGQVGKFIVDIKNLEKVGADHVKNPLMWHHDRFDPNFIFRDAATQEVFVFDKFLLALINVSVSISEAISVCKNFNCFKKLVFVEKLVDPIINKNFRISC